MEQTSSDSLERAKFLHRWLDEPDRNSSFEQTINSLHDVRSAWQAEMAERLRVPMNQKLSKIPKENHHEKKQLARWVNQILEPLGLAVLCPVSGVPSTLMGQRGTNDAGLFQFTNASNRGSGKRFGGHRCQTLPELSFTGRVLRTRIGEPPPLFDIDPGSNFRE